MFTPTPTHPPIQGNRQRIFDICRALRTVGAELTVQYYATEDVSAEEARQMREAWGEVDIVFPRDFSPRQSLARYPALDDWYDDSITEAVRRLCVRRHFDACVVNYVWYSKLFDALPSSVVRVLDTHDVFGGRAARFAELGLTAEWFHTSAAEESKGLDRSDFVIAIQSEETALFEAATQARVRTVGLLSAPDLLPAPHPRRSGPLKAGYIASGNPFNVSSILSFARALEAHTQLLDMMEFHVAGQVCAALARIPHRFVLHGKTESVRDFYESMDVAINPMTGGTGLKIKSIEALSFGRPLAATRDAMIGIPTSHPGHELAGSPEIVKWLIGLAEERSRLAEESEISRRVFRAYRQAQLRAFRDLWSEIRSECDLRRAHASKVAGGVAE